MPKRNIVWIAVGAVIAVLLWKVPEALIRRDSLYRQFSPLADVSLQIQKNYVEQVEDEELLRGAIEGMLRRLDPYCEYFDESEAREFSERTGGQFYGIGIEIDVGKRQGEPMVVVSPIEGSPAFRAGLQARDQITEIDGQPTDDLTLRQGVGLIKGGEPDSSVTLTIYRPSTGEVFNKTIRRGHVQVLSVRGWARSRNGEWDYLIDPKLRIGYMRIASFDEPTDVQLHEVVQELLKRNELRALVLDVRNNPGGLLEIVVRIVDRFVSKGKIVITKGRHKADQVYMATQENTHKPLLRMPLVVLVNHGSASASEILAGALQVLHDRATIVGARTYGKGSVQTVFPLDDDKGVVKLTTGYYYLPNGDRVDGTGVTPDTNVELTPEEREEVRRAERAFYDVSVPTATQAATSTAPADGRIEMLIDRQVQTGLDVLREQLEASSPDG